MLSSILALILNWIYAALEGRREGLFWHYKQKSEYLVVNPKIEDNHPYFAAQRILFWVFIFFSFGIIPLISSIISFPFFHLGNMYYLRNRLNEKIYTKGWWSDNSMSGTQKITFFKRSLNSGFQRIIYFIISILLVCFFRIK